MGDRRESTDADLLQAFRDAVRAKIVRDLESEKVAASDRKQRVNEALRRGIAQARREELCAAAWLFGSYAWGAPGVRSDVDLLVEGCADPMLVASLVGRETRTDVHVVTERDAPKSLRERVHREGVPL